MDIFLIKNYNLNILSLSTSFQFGRKENSGTLIFVGRSLVFSVRFCSLTSQISSWWQSTNSHTSYFYLVLRPFPFLFVLFSSSCHCFCIFIHSNHPRLASINYPQMLTITSDKTIHAVMNRSFFFFIKKKKKPSNLFLRMPIFKIFILTNLLIIPAIVTIVYFKTFFESCTFHQRIYAQPGCV